MTNDASRTIAIPTTSIGTVIQGLDPATAKREECEDAVILLCRALSADTIVPYTTGMGIPFAVIVGSSAMLVNSRNGSYSLKLSLAEDNSHHHGNILRALYDRLPNTKGVTLGKDVGGEKTLEGLQLPQLAEAINGVAHSIDSLRAEKAKEAGEAKPDSVLDAIAEIQTRGSSVV